jgi:hypothetical protein
MPAAVLTTLTAWLKGEIQNYAMVGDSLWVLTEERVCKISVSGLDMDTAERVSGYGWPRTPFERHPYCARIFWPWPSKLLVHLRPSAGGCLAE